jgi:hypothetical protein
MARYIEAKDTTTLTPQAHLYTPDRVRQSFNYGLAMLEKRAKPVDDIQTLLVDRARKRLAMTEGSLEMMGFSKSGLSSGRPTEGDFRHVFSRTGEEIEFASGVFTAGPINELNFLSSLEMMKAQDLMNRLKDGIDLDPQTIENHLYLAESCKEAAQTLEENSVPYAKYYDFDGNHPDIEAIKEAYAYFFIHSKNGLESTIDPSLAHNQADWYQTIRRLQEERILKLPPEAIVNKEAVGKKRFFKGCLPIITQGIGIAAVALMFTECNPFLNNGEPKPAASPSPLVAEKPSGVPAVGIINGVPTVEIRQSPGANPTPIFKPHLEAQTSIPPTEAAEANPNCVSDMEMVIIEIKQEGDADANRIYRYPNRVNPAGDSAKGLFDKELVNSYVKDNPNSETAISYSLRNQRNEGRDVQASNPDLLTMLDEARIFYGQPVTDAAFLAWVDSIRRNNPPGTLRGDLLNAPEFRAQSPESIIKRLQAYSQP